MSKENEQVNKPRRSFLGKLTGGVLGLGMVSTVWFSVRSLIPNILYEPPRKFYVLNHYIGMAELKKEDFIEFKWIPLAIIVFVILSLRTVIVGTFISVFDELLLLSSFGVYSLWSFYHRLYLYGHNLDPKASVQIEPFTPPVFGYKMVGQFSVWSYPAAGSWCFTAFALLLVASFIFIRSWRKKDQQLR